MAVFRIAFASETLFRTVNLNVIVPVETYGRTDVKKPEKFKTLYLLHGFGGSQDDWMDYSNLRAISEKYNLAIVLPSGENSFYENMNSIAGHYSDFTGKEIVDFTRRMFPLSERREDTYIGGLSMGGFGALRLGSLYHETFGKLFTLSGAFIIDNISGQKAGYSDSIADYDYYVRTFGDLDCLKDSEKDPMYCVKKAVLQKNMPEVYQAVGTEDFLIEENRMMKKRLEKEGVKVTYYEAEGIHGRFGINICQKRWNGCWNKSVALCDIVRGYAIMR